MMKENKAVNPDPEAKTGFEAQEAEQTPKVVWRGGKPEIKVETPYGKPTVIITRPDFGALKIFPEHTSLEFKSFQHPSIDGVCVIYEIRINSKVDSGFAAVDLSTDTTRFLL